jgi:hypothetical protein
MIDDNKMLLNNNKELKKDDESNEKTEIQLMNFPSKDFE